MRSRWTLLFLLLVAGADYQSTQAGEQRTPNEKPVPQAHKNHVRKASADYLTCFRRIVWHYDFATAAELARETGRPMFVIFCRAGTITDPASGKTKCAS